MSEKIDVIERRMLGRKERIITLKEMLKKSDESLDVVLARFCFRFGVTTRKAKEYYRVLVNAGEINDRAGRDRGDGGDRGNG